MTEQHIANHYLTVAMALIPPLKHMKEILVCNLIYVLEEKLSSAGDSWYWVDSTRGVGNRIMSDNSNGQDGFGLNAFNTDGLHVVVLIIKIKMVKLILIMVGKLTAVLLLVTGLAQVLHSTVQANTTAGGFSIVSRITGKWS